MKKIKIFLASSYELKKDREKIEREIARKNKLWIDNGFFLQLEIWEDLTAKMSPTRSQDEYNKVIKESDMFVLLAYSKVGMYTKEEFETAFGSFQTKKKPFILTYFKNIKEDKKRVSLDKFKNKLTDLGHFYSPYTDFNSFWIQFNKELDRLLLNNFTLNDQTKKNERIVINEKGVHIKNQFIGGTFKNTNFE